jgi:hypothetical protein
MNTAGDARHGCYVAYLVPGKLLLLLPDSGDAGEATFREIGMPGTLETPQCYVHVSRSSMIFGQDEAAFRCRSS